MPLAQSLIYKKTGLALCLTIIIGIFLYPLVPCLADISQTKVIDLSNLVRAEQGLDKLDTDKQLMQAARHKAKAIIEEQTFSHTLGNRRFSSWIKQAGYEYNYVGENLAIDFATESGAINAWLASPTHRKNLLNPEFTEIGVAILEDRFQDRETTLIVQVFGKPLEPATASRSNQQVAGTSSPPGEKTAYHSGAAAKAGTSGPADPPDKQDLGAPLMAAGKSTDRPGPNQLVFSLAAAILLAFGFWVHHVIAEHKRKLRLPVSLKNKEQLPVPIGFYKRQKHLIHGHGQTVKNI